MVLISKSHMEGYGETERENSAYIRDQLTSIDKLHKTRDTTPDKDGRDALTKVIENELLFLTILPPPKLSRQFIVAYLKELMQLWPDMDPEPKDMGAAILIWSEILKDWKDGDTFEEIKAAIICITELLEY